MIDGGKRSGAKRILFYSVWATNNLVHVLMFNFDKPNLELWYWTLLRLSLVRRLFSGRTFSNSAWACCHVSFCQCQRFVSEMCCYRCRQWWLVRMSESLNRRCIRTRLWCGKNLMKSAVLVPNYRLQRLVEFTVMIFGHFLHLRRTRDSTSLYNESMAFSLAPAVQKSFTAVCGCYWVSWIFVSITMIIQTSLRLA